MIFTGAFPSVVNVFTILIQIPGRIHLSRTWWELEAWLKQSFLPCYPAGREKGYRVTLNLIGKRHSFLVKNTFVLIFFFLDIEKAKACLKCT